MYCDGGLSNATIMLYNSTEKYLLDYKLTNYKGYFKFDSLPFGSYYVISDMPRYTTSTPYKLILTEQNPEIEGLVFEINNDIITMRYNNEAAENNVTKTSIYPNPCDMNFNIEFSNISSNDILFIEIYNILGEKVHHQTIKGEKNMQIAEMHVNVKSYDLRAVTETKDLYASIDKDIDILEGQIRKLKTKKERMNKEESIRLKEANLMAPETVIEKEVIKNLYYEIKPISIEDAKMKLEEKVGNIFLTFVNIDTGKVNVIYKLKDSNNYGLVEPEA